MATFERYFIADVLDIDFVNRRLAVYIPKLMPGIAGDQAFEATIQTVDTGSISGLQNYNSTMKIKNSLWVSPWDFKEALPVIGSKVAVLFLEGNPKTGYWTMFNPNNNYEIIEEEKYPKIMDIKFANSNISVNRDDNLEFVFPSNYYSVLNTTGKTKKVELFNKQIYSKLK